jgi:hypothetical protein
VRVKSETLKTDYIDALDLKLTGDDLKELDQAFPPPQRKIPLEMI